MLKQLRLSGEPGLRGIEQILVPFPYPITAICGKNGVGKSTVLALAALSARPPEDWQVYWGNARPRTRPGVRRSYTFKDFFHRRRGDPLPDGLRLGWVSMISGNELEYTHISKGSRWTRVTDAARHSGNSGLPIREIDFVPMSRVLPAVEHGPVRSAFIQTSEGADTPLNPEALGNLSYIMGRSYDEARTTYVRGLSLATCRAGATYSGFDMGSGESSIIVLLSRLQAARTGGLILIEELELGLHAEAQARLVEILLKYCQSKRLQIICTTHSETILDSLPRIARILVRRSGNQHEVITDVSTRFAIHEMSGNFQPELMVYTEDRFAAEIVEEAMAGPLRSRIEVRDVGSNATLARQAVSHLRSETQLQALSVFDGDCSDSLINGWIHAEQAERDISPEWLILPGEGLTPEQWVLRELGNVDYLTELGQEISCSTEVASSHREEMRVQLEQHDCGYVLGQRTGLDQHDARRRLIRSVARRHPALQTLRDRIERLLES